jgi:hypothetical protein
VSESERLRRPADGTKGELKLEGLSQGGGPAAEFLGQLAYWLFRPSRVVIIGSVPSTGMGAGRLLDIGS